MKYHSLYDTSDNTFWMPLGSIAILKPSYLPTLTVKYEDFNSETKTTLVSVQESVLADNLQDLLRRQNVALVHPSTTTACKYSDFKGSPCVWHHFVSSMPSLRD